MQGIGGQAQLQVFTYRLGLQAFLRILALEQQLLQLAFDGEAVCIDPLALPDLSPIAPLLASASTIKIMHAARQDLEVLLPAVGLVQPVFDTQIAAALAGVSVSSLENLVRIRQHENQPLADADLAKLKKGLVERDSAGLVEFIDSKRTLQDYFGQEALKTWLRQDIELWRQGDLKALPMGYLLCGPVGTGKTYLTAKEAVRLCDGSAPDSREASRAREIIRRQHEPANAPGLPQGARLLAIAELAEQIVQAQREEIAQMRGILERLDD